MAERYRRHSLQIELNLMVGPAKRRNRNTAPASANRPMNVAVEDVFDVAMPTDDLREELRILDAKIVLRGETDVERRMVHEDIDALAGCVGQLLIEPTCARWAIGSPVRPFLDRVEHEKTCFGVVDGILVEIVYIPLYFRKGAAELLPAVMISNRQKVWDLQFVQAGAEIEIGFRLSGIGEIARKDAEIRICLPGIDICNAGLQTGLWIQAAKVLARRHEMDI